MKRLISMFSLAIRRISLLHPLQVVLLLGLLQGLVFIAVVPPWWHNDEPTNFEYAWLLANRPGWAERGQFDEGMRHEVAASMIEHHWYDILNAAPNLRKQAVVWIGTSQLGDPPLYFGIVAIPLYLGRGLPFEIQDYVARLVSLLFYIGTLWVAWKVVGELTEEGHPLQWMTGIFLALSPGFVDTMTSVNNDVGAVLAYSIFLFFAIKMLRRGIGLWNLVGLLVAAAACYYSKNTAMPAIPLTLVVLLLASMRGRLLPVALGLLAAATAVGLGWAIRPGDAAYWYRQTPQNSPTRQLDSQAPFGKYAFRLIDQPGAYVGQLVSPSTVALLKDRTITVGAWMWSDRAIAVAMPWIRSWPANATPASPLVPYVLTSVPSFVSQTFSVPADVQRLWLVLDPGGGAGETVYYDGVVMTQQVFTTGQPVFADESATGGTWNGVPFENLARAASAESSWLSLNPGFSGILDKVSPILGDSDVFLTSLQDPIGTGSYYRDAVSRLFVTFWGAPTRARIGLLGGRTTYMLLVGITGIGALGWLAFVSHKPLGIRWDFFVVMGLSLIVVWGVALLRGANDLIHGGGVIPWARYVFPSIIPSALLICIGWWQGLRFLAERLKFGPGTTRNLFVAFMAALDVLALLSTWTYFSWKGGQADTVLWVSLVVALFLILQAMSRHGASPHPI